MRLSQLFEVPLPDDWDKTIYNERIPFTQRVRYAKERAATVGSGSARIAFEIPYKGRPTILKIAKNRKGMAQNEVEAEVLSDGFHGRNGPVVPLIDYDEQNYVPTWIHTEKADKVKSSKHLAMLFMKHNDPQYNHPFDMMTVEWAIKTMLGERTFFTPPQKEKDAVNNNELVGNLTAIVSDFDLGISDVTVKSNWGVYRGDPVLLDLGANNTVLSTYYM